MVELKGDAYRDAAAFAALIGWLANVDVVGLGPEALAQNAYTIAEAMAAEKARRGKSAEQVEMDEAYEKARRSLAKLRYESP